MSWATNCPNTGHPAASDPSTVCSPASHAAPSTPRASRRASSTSRAGSSGNIRPYLPSNPTIGASTGRNGARQWSRAAAMTTANDPAATVFPSRVTGDGTPGAEAERDRHPGEDQRDGHYQGHQLVPSGRAVQELAGLHPPERQAED